jgi:hypothetical protein
MDTPNNQVAPDLNEKPEDAALEQEALTEVKEDAIRAQVLTDLGIADIEDNAEYIDKIVAREKQHRQKLATAIRQKQGWREKAQKPTPAAPERPIVREQSNTNVEDVEKLVDSRLDDRMDDAKLSEIELSDEAKAELKAYAKSKGITARQALKTDYFTFLKDAEDRKKREDEASISRDNKPPAPAKYSLDKPPQVDMSTPEGQAEWDKYMDWAIKQKQ